MRIGFFGGSFNPPSHVHINLARIIIREYHLDKLFFVPVGDYYQKKDLIKANHRCNMLKLAIEDEKNIEIDTLAAESKTKLYASDTFRIIKEKYKGNEIFFIMGSDNYRKMPSWKDYNELINNYKIIVIERERKKTRKTNKKNIFEFIPEKLEEIDSSKIRKMISNNEDVTSYINENVYKYIKKNELYEDLK